MPTYPEIHARNEVILRLYSEGLEYTEIAVKMRISYSTVKHVCRGIARPIAKREYVCRHCGISTGSSQTCPDCYFSVNRGPQIDIEPEPTDHAPGTAGRIEVLRQRAERGEMLWSDGDKNDYDGLVGAVEPRNVSTLGEKLGRRDANQPSTRSVHVVRTNVDRNQ